MSLFRICQVYAWDGMQTAVPVRAVLAGHPPMRPDFLRPAHKFAALLTLDPATISMLTSAAMLAPDGRCKTLDAGADG